MNIVLTNDDGIFAPGLAALYRALVPLGDVGAMADAISGVLADSTRAAALARQARAASIQKFGMARSARAIERMYERVLGLR